MSELTTIARPYAKAVFDLAVYKGELDKWSEMLAFAAAVASNETIIHYISSMHSAKKDAEIFIFVCGEQLNESGQNLIKVMAINGRLNALPNVYTQFKTLRYEHDNQMDVDVLSAIALDQTQLDIIINKLEIRLERQVQLHCSIDETLIAGVIIRAENLVIDNSVSGYIRRLNNALQS
ncbi:F0F1 ATP synthase subunit delta [Candidatus Enterovibrio altilux]|uniref:ATP synthase subunit delta n=1 Tax=Candidatus Enterovibrio altilux TaxID=1927128 RepID=A0A291B943_9GAMM|nr:F0F1 ATP synthase subunit delta [Candidatus Enterovibrio luxaltus]ATF09514.1 ATP synthase delta chain [Candidatus Enterovibrio luxaltus]